MRQNVLPKKFVLHPIQYSVKLRRDSNPTLHYYELFNGS